MKWLTINELKDYWYNRYQLQNLRKNWKVRYRNSPIEYCLIDVKRASKEDFLVDEKIRTLQFWAKDIFNEEEIKELEAYMKEFWSEYRKAVMKMFEWNFMSLNEYSKEWPLNSHDNKSLYQLAQWFVRSKNTHFEKKKKLTKEKIEKFEFVNEENKKIWRIQKRKYNDMKLRLNQKREIPKFKFYEKNFYYSIWNEHYINPRIKIVWNTLRWFWNKKFVNKKLPETIQTWKIHYNKNWKLICSVTVREMVKKEKCIWACWIDIWIKSISAAKVDKNWCLIWRKTWQLWNIVNLRQKKVHIEKILIEIKKWAWNYNKFVMEDLSFRQWVKWRTLHWWPYSKIMQAAKSIFRPEFVNPAFTSFIWLVKYWNMWMSLSHNKNSKDESAAFTIWRRWLWFQEKIPALLKEILASQSEKPSIGNWKFWSSLKRLGELTTLSFVKVFYSLKKRNREKFKMRCLEQLRDYGISGFRQEIKQKVSELGLNLRIIGSVKYRSKRQVFYNV